MNDFFHEELAKELKCYDCDTVRVARRRYCLKHLAEYKERWKLWSILRRRAGKCCYCDEPAQIWRGIFGLRCKSHREENRRRCVAWQKDHVQEQAAASKERIDHYRAQGRCPHCKEHPLLEPDYAKCKDCRTVHHGSPESVRLVRLQRRARRVAASEAALEELIRKYPKALDRPGLVRIT